MKNTIFFLGHAYAIYWLMEFHFVGGTGGGEKVVGRKKVVGIEKVGRNGKVGNKFFWAKSLRGGLC